MLFLGVMGVAVGVFIRRSFLILLICVFGYTTSGLAAKTSQGWPIPPSFTLLDMKGYQSQLSDHVGKTVIVNFWAVWCAPCRMEIPAMNRALDELKDENIALLAINVGDAKEAIQAFSQNYPMKFPVLMDSDAVVSQQWQVTAFPSTFILNPQGKIVRRIVGAREWDSKDMLDSLRSVATQY